MDEELQLLEREYCPPVDEALVRSLWADYAGEQNAVQLAKQSLDTIREAAVAEQTSDFDPSGSSGDVLRSNSSRSGTADDESNVEEGVSWTTEEDQDSGCFNKSEHFDLPTKEWLLAETFPTLRLELVARTLKKCDYNLSKATDELLNHVYFSDASAAPAGGPVIPKGIDAFSEEHHVPQRGKKWKGKKKLNAVSGRAVSASESDIETPSTNHWLHGTQHVEFIASRTGIPSTTISSLYHRNGTSVSATIKALIEKDLEKTSGIAPEEILVQGALDLLPDTPDLDLEHAISLLRLTSSSQANALDLAKALTAPPSKPSNPQETTRVLPRYAPLRLSDPTPEPPAPRRARNQHSETTTPSPLPPTARPQTTASLSQARSTAFTQAAAAHRLGKSQPLMKAAAGYYSQLGRDLSANLRVLSDRDADVLVASQSTSSVVDLHGVSVAAAMRIAREKVAAWWEGLGEKRVLGRRGVGDGIRIVTGLGRHSEGGRGKLGPAVVRALVAGGWKVEVGSGEVVVLGRRAV